MRQCRASFKYALRICKLNEETIRSDNMTRELCEKNMVEFWKSVRTLSKSKIANSTCINGTYGESNIAQQMKSYFENILNSVNDEYTKESVLSHLKNIDFNNDMYVTCNEIQQAFTELEGKSCRTRRNFY